MRRMFAISGAAGGNLKRMTLELRHVEGAQPRQVQISRVVAEDWVVGDRMFDEGFR